MSETTRRWRIEAVANGFIERGAYSGIEWSVWRGDAEWTRGRAGQADALAGRAMAEKPIFRIYSMTKPIVSMVALMLIEEGRLRLYDPVAAFLPGFAEMKVLERDGTTRKAGRPMLIENLLTHRAGLSYSFLPDCPTAPLYAEARLLDPSVSLNEMIERLAELPLAYDPGTRWQYSVATDVLARVIEIVTGKSIGEVLAERIFAPLGMTDTSYVVPESERGRVMGMFGTEDLDVLFSMLGQPQTLTPVDIETSYPSGDPGFSRGGHGLFSTVDDYIAFARFVKSGHSASGERLLSRKMVDLAWTNRVPDSQRPIAIGPIPFPGYGFGLAGRVMVDLGQALSLTNVGECGWAGAASTYFWVDRDEDMVGVVMAQYLGARLPLADDMRAAVYQALDD